MKTKITAILFSFFIIISTNSSAEKAPIKYGKASKKELEMTQYKPDTSANAVILCDYGSSYFVYNNENGFNVIHKRIIRIKILKKEGYEWARREILLRKKYDELSQLKAISYNLEDGKITKTKLDSKEKYTEDYNKYWDIVKFEMPNVKVGTVIDIQYTTLSKSWRIQNWFFQDEIPTKLSRLDLRIPEYFTYKKLQKGYYPIKIIDEMETQSSFSYRYEDPKPGPLGKKQIYTGTVGYTDKNQIFIAENIPAFVKESKMTCMNDYRSAMDFELQRYKFKYGMVRNVTATWEGVCKNLMDNSDFGHQLKKGHVLKQEIEKINNTCTSDQEKIAALYYLIQSQMSWNKYRSAYSDNISRAWDKRNGSVGDINLLLVAGLKKMGFNAEPVILSTRNNGRIHPAQIIISQFNYVVASVKLDDKIMLLDATDKDIPVGALPERCLNDKGRLIKEGGGEWVKLDTKDYHGNTYKVDFAFNNTGTALGTIHEVHKNYAAYDIRKQIKNYNDNSEFIKEYNHNISIELDSIENKDNSSEAVELFYQFESENNVEVAGDLVLLNPFVTGNKTQNPFKLEKREYPVEYSFPEKETYMASISIPEGFKVEELPKPTRVALPNKAASFLYSVNQSGNTIVIVSRFNINKLLFLPQEYNFLKEFYNVVINTQGQQIILKKI